MTNSVYIVESLCDVGDDIQSEQTLGTVPTLSEAKALARGHRLVTIHLWNYETDDTNTVIDESESYRFVWGSVAYYRAARRQRYADLYA